MGGAALAAAGQAVAFAERAPELLASHGRQPLSRKLLRRETLSFPFMVLKTLAAIYWEAGRLLLKRTPIFDHQKTKTTLQSSSAATAKEQSDDTHTS